MLFKLGCSGAMFFIRKAALFSLADFSLQNAIILTPITIDFGTQLSNAPTAIAKPLPLSSASDGWCLPERLRCFAP